MIRKEFLVSGRVKGVGFRFFCKYQASLLSLTGYAENLDDGQVHTLTTQVVMVNSYGQSG